MLVRFTWLRGITPVCFVTSIITGLGDANLARAEPEEPPPDAAESGEVESDETSRAAAPSVSAPAASPAPAPAVPENQLIPDGSAPKAPVPPAFPPAIPNIDYGSRMRVGGRLQRPLALGAASGFSSTIDADLYFSGQIHRMLKWQFSATLSYAGTIGTPSTVNLSVLDVIARFEPLPELNIFLGRMIVVNDRFGPSGPWGMDEWFYPGILPGAPPAVPKTGPVGRDVGVNVWGALFDGHAKYYLGAYQLQDPALRPLYTGRLQISLLSPEPSFYQRTTYYGDKDLLSFGVGGQYQRAGSVQALPPGMMGIPLTDNLTEVNADLVVDKNLGDAGTLSLQAAGYLFGGDYRPYKSLYLGSIAYLFPTVIGIGKLRPSVRYQQIQSAVPGTQQSQVLDVQLSYVIMNWFARVHVGYRRASLDVGQGPVQTTMLFFGVVLADP